jgi:acyl-CoA thioesterase FadM
MAHPFVYMSLFSQVTPLIVRQRALDSHPSVAFATGSLSVTYLKPVPIDASVELTARISERMARKSRLECDVTARGELCARAEVVAIRLVGELGSGG